MLDDFGQPVAKLRYEDGTWTGLFRHVLKVFLLDEQNRVRNIYSTGIDEPGPGDERSAHPGDGTSRHTMTRHGAPHAVAPARHHLIERPSRA